jgi:hypothetical protein
LKKEKTYTEKQAETYAYKYIDILNKAGCLTVVKTDEARKILETSLLEFSKDVLKHSIELKELDAMISAGQNGMFFSIDRPV